MAQAVNNFTLTGNIAQVPEVKKTANGKHYCFVTIAVNGLNKDKADFISFIVWENLAKNIITYCGKGDCISVHGFISVVKKDDKTSIQLTADSVTFLHKAGSGKKKDEPEKKPEPENDVFEEVSNDPFANW